MFGSTEDEDDIRPEIRATQVTFFDQAGHLVPFDFDSDVLQNGLEIYFAGYLKCLIDEGAVGEGGVPVAKVGPLIEWWISGYGKGENIVLGVSTESAHYYITASNEIYSE